VCQDRGCSVVTERWKAYLDDSEVVVALLEADGEAPSYDWVEALADVVQSRYQKYFEYLRDGHRVKSPENMKHLKSDSDGVEVHELKHHAHGGYRLYIVKFEGRWHTTHGVKKVKDKQVPAEISKAFDLFYNWQERETGNGNVSEG
jgi:hypothetical protein